MALDVFFLLAGVVLVAWGVVGVVNPELSWRINAQTGLRARDKDGQRSPDWAQMSRRFGWYGIVIGAFNIVLSVTALF